MVEAGQIRLVGTLDTSDIERGQRRISTQFENIDDRARNTNTSFSQLGGITKGLVTSFAALGAVGGGSLIAIATNAPQTAGAMASIQASSQRLSFAVGEELAPSFEKAAELYADFVDSAGTEGTLSNTGIKTFGAVFQGLGSDIENVISWFDKLGENKIYKFLFGEKEKSRDYNDKFFQDELGNWQFKNQNEKQSLSEYYTQTFLPKISDGGFFTNSYGSEGLGKFMIWNAAPKLVNSITDVFTNSDTMGGNEE